MWIVLHFLNDDAVEAVPETWYKIKEKTCAWPCIQNIPKNKLKKKTTRTQINLNGYL